ncbi:MAG: hypothetical protein KDD45_01110 [Bdellovibrionales bacterium]|nr:hypothetical protein [Bdellovibrionales bacterium]
MSYIQIAIVAFSFLSAWLFPSSTDGRKFVSLTHQVSITTHKNFPPHIAFESMTEKSTVATDERLTAANNNTEQVIRLSTESNESAPNKDPRPNLTKLVLAPIEINKKELAVYQNAERQPGSMNSAQLSDVENNKNNSWMQDLKPYLKSRLAKNGTITKGFAGPKSNSKLVNESGGTFASEDKKVQQESVPDNLVVGLIEIKDGLAVTNQQHIEIRRYEEGTFKEKGSVNLAQGTYQLNLESPRGYILARLVNSSGNVLGEGVARVADIHWGKILPHKGPIIHITKKFDIKGTAVSAYNLNKNKPLDHAGNASVFNNYAKHDVKTNGEIVFDNVVSESTTKLITKVPGHISTQQLILSGSEFQSIVYPEKMIHALKAVVSDQRQQNLNDPALTVVMGQIIFDNKPTSGVNVQIEGFEDIEPVYFNSLMLPDATLKTTSENGYFAFLGAPVDIQHIIALRGNVYFGHANVIVSPGVVSYAQIKNSIKTEETDIKVYDAFQGQPQTAQLTLQSLPEKVNVQNGEQTVYLPSVKRWSLLHANPGEKFQPAYYSYVDRTDHIYVPLISKSWLYQIVSSLKINVDPGTGIIVGFVNDEDFDVELPGHENLKKNILYFDYTGRVSNQKSGSQGGGFVMFNVPPDIYEVLVLGAKSQKVYSQVAPVKDQDLFVFSFKLN